jgi:predicted DNA-binding transcriptional regulator AlpA
MSHCDSMYSTRQAAAKLGLTPKTLSRYIAAGKVPAPQIMKVGSASLHGWTDTDIERVRALLPKIANGRKTRYKKKDLALSSQQSRQARDRSAKAKGKTKNKKKK